MPFHFISFAGGTLPFSLTHSCPALVFMVHLYMVYDGNPLLTHSKDSPEQIGQGREVKRIADPSAVKV